MPKKIVFSIITLVPILAISSELPRIGSLKFNSNIVQKVFVTEGRSSVFIFPCPVKTYSTGPTKDIEAALNERDSTYLEVWLGKVNSQPAGLKVFCNDSYFVFDIIPSQINHQDIIKVSATNSIPQTIAPIRKLYRESSQTEVKKIDKKKLIMSSESIK